MNQVDWHLLAFFAALFILSKMIKLNHLTEGLYTLLAPFLDRGAAQLSIMTALLLNLVSNVPAVLL